jgi:hypothetical protein
MKRRIRLAAASVMVAVGLVALLVQGQAAAAHKKHHNTNQTIHGILPPGGTIHFKVHYSSRTKRTVVSEFGYTGLTMNCADGPRTEFFNSIGGSYRVVKGHFSANIDAYTLWGPAAPGGMHVTHSTLLIDGVLGGRPGERHASGTIHRFGHISHQSGDGSGIEPGSDAYWAGLADGLGGPYCDSGVINWTAFAVGR